MKGDFSKTNKYLKRVKEKSKIRIAEEYARKGVEALREYTPVDTGLTASSWSYKVERSSDSITISFSNSNVVEGVPIAIILQYGHGTGNGGWVEGRDYINPALQPIFDSLADDAWKDITNL